MQKTILLGTRKGLIAYHFSKNKWKVENLSFEGRRFQLLMPIQEQVPGGPVLTMDIGA